MTDEIPALMTRNRGRSVLLRLRNGQTIRGTLRDFDVYLNLTLDDAEDVTSGAARIGSVLLRGDNILVVSLPDAKQAPEDPA